MVKFYKITGPRDASLFNNPRMQNPLRWWQQYHESFKSIIAKETDDPSDAEFVTIEVVVVFGALTTAFSKVMKMSLPRAFLEECPGPDAEPRVLNFEGDVNDKKF